MKEDSGDWLWEPIPQRDQTPCDRFKHACALSGGFVYILGGRNTTILSDFWRYSIECNEWESLLCCDQSPENLEGHSIVAYKGVLYVFGGMLDSGFTQGKIPLWMYNIDSEEWVPCHSKETELEFPGPVNRKSHSAVVYECGMYIYGGYLDLKGASDEFWYLNFDSMKWTFLPPGSSDCGPGHRYGHSSVVYNEAMYVFGGLVGMAEKNDLWTWNFYNQTWTIIKAGSGPPKVMGHSSVVYEDFMLIFGGGKPNDNPTNDIWTFQFSTQTWKKIPSKGGLPISKIYHSLLGVGMNFQQVSKPYKGSPKQRFIHIPKESQQVLSTSNPFQLQRSNKVSGHTNGMEMKIFTQFPGLPPFSSKQIISKDCTSDAQILLPKVETSFLNPMFCCPEEEEITKSGFLKDNALQQRNLSEKGINKNPDVLLLIGGKPLSRSASISVWKMMVPLC